MFKTVKHFSKDFSPSFKNRLLSRDLPRFLGMEKPDLATSDPLFANLAQDLAKLVLSLNDCGELGSGKLAQMQSVAQRLQNAICGENKENQ